MSIESDIPMEWPEVEGRIRRWVNGDTEAVVMSEDLKLWLFVLDQTRKERDAALNEVVRSRLAHPDRERLAALEHDQWAHWTTHMLSVLQEAIGLGFYEARDNNLDTEGLQKARETLEQWRRQLETPYAELTEKEKDSDREWADKVLAILSNG